MECCTQHKQTNNAVSCPIVYFVVTWLAYWVGDPARILHFIGTIVIFDIHTFGTTFSWSRGINSMCAALLSLRSIVYTAYFSFQITCGEVNHIFSPPHLLCSWVGTFCFNSSFLAAHQLSVMLEANSHVLEFRLHFRKFQPPVIVQRSSKKSERRTQKVQLL